MNPLNIGGVDEAGLGPILGPYTAALTLFEVPQQVHLYNLLHPFIQKTPHADGIAVADSKALFSQNSGLGELEKSVLVFYCLFYPFPETFKDFFSFLLVESEPWDLEAAPWYADLGKCPLPVKADRAEILHLSGQLKKWFQEREVKMHPLSLVLAPALRFNQLLLQWKNKARVCQQLLNPLLKEALSYKSLELTVDRQGGRRFYGDWLMELMPGEPLSADRELKNISRYTSRDRGIQFMVSADALHLETALASMVAKYSRELIMGEFNRYWQGLYPGLKATAGYYNDGKRFIKELSLHPDRPRCWNLMERLK